MIPNQIITLMDKKWKETLILIAFMANFDYSRPSLDQESLFSFRGQAIAHDQQAPMARILRMPIAGHIGGFAGIVPTMRDGVGISEES